MYNNPITKYTEDIILNNIMEKEESLLVESVHKVGFNVDKEELAKALQYDRNQYEKGFNDGVAHAEMKWIPVTERLPKIKNNAKRVIVTTSWGRVGEAYFCADHWEINDIPYKMMSVVAWMPLPEPWKGGNDEVN